MDLLLLFGLLETVYGAAYPLLAGSGAGLFALRFVLLFALFLGGLGAHHFYLGRTVAGVLSLLLFWTFLPAIFALIEALFMGATVSGVNAKAFDEGLRMAGFGYLAK